MHFVSSSDVDYFLEELKKLSTETDNERLLQSFVQCHLPQFMDILHDYKALKDLEHVRRLDEMKNDKARTIVEGFSEDTIEEAFRDALNKVAVYFSAKHDVSTTVLGLVHLPKGGHRAVLEVHISSMSMHDEAHPSSPDVQRKRAVDQEYEDDQERRRHHAEKLIFDHFLEISNAPVYVPDYFKVMVSDAEILNLMIEKEFFGATHELPKNILSTLQPVPNKKDVMPEMIVKFDKKDQPHPEIK